MSYDFHVGQKVVCIDDKFKHVSIDQLIRKGEIYTIRWVGEYTHYIDGTFIGVKLAEINRGNDDGPEGYGAADMPYRATRFRPLVKDKISSLRKLLAPTPDAPVEPKEKIRKKKRSERWRAGISW
ncbi:CAP-Gly domain protein [Rhizobium laguerreae]|uniref:CAP-Gly domain protein n=1 Tax=Rhizobium laguerreae TaxID=1076926 RepID=UPI003000C24A